MQSDLETALGEIEFAPASITLVRNLTGRAMPLGAVLDAAYWRRQVREPVAFRACVETLTELGVDTPAKCRSSRRYRSETEREGRRSLRIHDILWQLSETGEHP